MLAVDHQKVVADAVAAEREACAKMVEEFANHANCYYCGGAIEVADAIRARGKK